MELKVMDNPYKGSKVNGLNDHGHTVNRLPPYQPYVKTSLPWLDVRIFYVRVTKFEIDDLTPEFLELNNIPFKPETLLEVNGVRNSYYSDGLSVLLRRDRLDRKSEEVTFVSTDSIRMTGAVKFEVYDKNMLLLSGVIDLCNSDGHIGEPNSIEQKWTMSCETDIVAGNGFFKEKQFMSHDSIPPMIEVYIAGSFLSSPIILTKTLQLSPLKTYAGTLMLDSIPENEANENQRHVPPSFTLQASKDVDCNQLYPGTAYMEEEDGELSWFKAGVRVGVGIGLSICVGIGIGVGLLVRTYQGTTHNFRRRLL